MSKSVMIIDTPSDCCECPFGTMAFGKSICFLDEGNGIDCPLKPYKDLIPIEWIKKYYEDITAPYTDTRIQFEEMIRKWEKENETN